MFNDKFQLTEAVLEGRKTMTRRIIYDFSNYGWGSVIDAFIENGVLYFDTGLPSLFAPKELQPKYNIGEVIAVAQPYREIMAYLADSFYQPYQDYMKTSAGYNNKMFVHADLMPHQLRITNVRVERLQDISENDCFREGIYKKTLFPPGDIDYFYHSEPRSKWDVYPSAIEAFKGLIDKVSGKGTWESNPWVFVYEFELANKEDAE